jgi:hypothetical protein
VILGELPIGSSFPNLNNVGPLLPGYNNTKQRLTSIPYDGAGHNQIIGQSLIYRIVVSPEEFPFKIERLRENEHLSFSRHNVPASYVGCTNMKDGLEAFKSTIRECSQTIPFDILYQFQALVQNGYLLPHTVQNRLSPKPRWQHFLSQHLR